MIRTPAEIHVRQCSCSLTSLSPPLFEIRCSHQSSPITHHHEATKWTLTHDGNDAATSQFPISKIAQSSTTLDTQITLPYPASHPASRWKQRTSHFEVLGRFGDAADFTSLPFTVQTPAMAAHFGAIRSASVDDSFVACGSPGEVTNDPLLGHKYALWLTPKDGGGYMTGDKGQLFKQYRIQAGKVRRETEELCTTEQLYCITLFFIQLSLRYLPRYATLHHTLFTPPLLLSS